MARCPNFSMTAWQHDTETRRVVLIRIGCGMWSCDVCANWLQTSWRRHLRARMPEIGENWRLLTFTASGWVKTVSESLIRIRRGLDLFFKRARRIWDVLEYARVYELHPKRGVLHVHVVIFGLTDFVARRRAGNGKNVFAALDMRTGHKGTWTIRTFVKKIALECGMGYIADVRNIPVGRAVHYVTKYLTKDQQKIDVKNLRHVQVSQGVGSPPKKDTGYWHTGRRIFKKDLYGDEKLYDADKRVIVSNGYWRDNEFYPPNVDDDSTC